MRANTVEVSVVIPAYNAERWLAATLESVLMQAEVGIEVLVVDDGSTDSTATIVAKFHQVRYLHKSNGGQASARNCGIQVARGEFIAFIDADDIWFPGKLRSQIDQMRERNWAWCYCDGVAFAGSQNRILYSFSQVQSMPQGDVLERLLLGNFIPSPSPVVLHSVFDQIGLFNEDSGLRNREDWEMWLRIAEHHALGFIPECYFGYRHHEANGTRVENHELALASKLRVISEAVSRNPARLKPLVAQARVNQAINSAKAALRTNQTLVTRRIAMGVMATQPTELSAYLLWLLSYLDSKMLKRIFSLRHSLRTQFVKLPKMKLE